MDQRTPNLFIIGAPKAGTTFAHHALRMAEGVHMSPVKEPGFFSSRDYGRGLRYYLDAYFATAAGKVVRGESTPWYLYSAIARRRIATLPVIDAPRFMVFVRRPSRRAVSMYRDQVRTRREARTFEQAVEDELAGLAEGDLWPDVRQRYVWCGSYVEHIERWRAEFGRDRVHVVVFEEMVADPDATWTEMAGFLGVPLGRSRFGDVDEIDKNPGGKLRWPRLDRFVRSFEGRNNLAIEAVKRVLPPGLHRQVLQDLGRRNRTLDPDGGPPDSERAMSAEVCARIDEACGSSTQRLEGMLGRSLTAWSSTSTATVDMSP